MVIRVVPSPSRVRDQAGPAPGTALLLRELLGLVLLTDLGRDDVEDPPTQDPQLARTEVRRLRNQMSLGPGQHLGRDLRGRQLVQRVSDHRGLRHVQLAPQRERRPHRAQRRSSASASARSRRLAA